MHILADCDGVLLNWEKGFHKWMRLKSYSRVRNDIYYIHEQYHKVARHEATKLMREFNHSAWMGYLAPFRDAVEGLQLLHTQGHEVTVITAMGGDKYSQDLRTRNLYNLFGDVIKKVIFTPDNEDKTEALSKYKDSGLYWLEDNPKNYETGLEFGLKSILMDHSHNMWYNASIRAESWKDICSIIGDKHVNKDKRNTTKTN